MSCKRKDMIKKRLINRSYKLYHTILMLTGKSTRIERFFEKEKAIRLKVVLQNGVKMNLEKGENDTITYKLDISDTGRFKTWKNYFVLG